MEVMIRSFGSFMLPGRISTWFSTLLALTNGQKTVDLLELQLPPSVLKLVSDFINGRTAKVQEWGAFPNLFHPLFWCPSAVFQQPSTLHLVGPRQAHYAHDKQTFVRPFRTTIYFNYTIFMYKLFKIFVYYDFKNLNV